MHFSNDYSFATVCRDHSSVSGRPECWWLYRMEEYLPASSLAEWMMATVYTCRVSLHGKLYSQLCASQLLLQNAGNLKRITEFGKLYILCKPVTYNFICDKTKNFIWFGFFFIHIYFSFFTVEKYILEYIVP